MAIFRNYLPVNLLNFLLLCFWAMPLFQTPKPAPIKIRLEGLKAGKGAVLLALFNKENGFPEDGKAAFRSYDLPANAELTLDGIPPGTYALALLHDLDGNKKMTYSFLGMPKDGYASSPSGGPRFSMPKFQESKFSHGASVTELKIKVHY